MKLTLIALLLTISCQPGGTSNPGPNVEVVPNIVVPQDINYCKPGCDNLSKLTGPDQKPGCLESRPLIYSDGGVQSCEDFCTMTEKNGKELSPKCWVNIQSCDEIEFCR